jgi:2-keto-4-pentenoate hydratase/2-oxohepta-3-ene-1,7-dioic acid hydratase in catechol pathway
MYHQLMRLGNFELEGERRLGVVDEESIVDLSRSGLPNDTVDLIAQWDREKVEQAVAGSPRYPRAEVRLLAPLLPRKNIMAVGRNYRDHAR